MPKKQSKSKKTLEKAVKELEKAQEKQKKAVIRIPKERPSKRPEIEPETVIIDEITDGQDDTLDNDDNDGIRGFNDNGRGIDAPPPPTKILDHDDYDTIYNIKESLISAGVPTDAEKKFLVSKKENSNKYTYQKTYYNEMPDLEVIGKELRGGDFSVSVHAEINGKKQIVKNYYFSISTDQFPPLPKEQPVQAGPSNPVSQDNSLLIEFMRQSNDKFNTLIEKLAGGSKMDEMLVMLKVVKELMPSQDQPKIPYNEMFKIQGEMFKAGIDYAKDINENKDKEDMGDVLLNMVKDIAGKIDFAGLQQKLLPSPTPAVNNPLPPVARPGNVADVPLPPAPAVKQVTMAQALEILNDFFGEIIVAFESELEVNPYIFAEKIKKLARYKLIDNFIAKMTNAEIFATFNKGELQARFENPDFKAYVETIIDIVRKFDIIELDDNGDIIEKKPVPVTVQPVKAETSGDKSNDNAGQPVTAEHDGPVTDSQAGETDKEV